MPITLNGTTGTQQPAAQLVGSTSGIVTLQGAANAGTWTMTLPTTAGAAAQLLQTDGAGVTSWGLSPTTAGNVLFTADGVNWSSTQKIVRGTAVATTSGTTVDFTGIPSWAKRITLMFQGVSTSGASAVIVQIGSGSFTTTGYVGTGTGYSSSSFGGSTAFTNGFPTEDAGNAAYLRHGQATLFNITGNTWVFSSTQNTAGTIGMRMGSGSIALAGALDRVRVTASNGTDTFDAGSVNILYE